jgi:hypothetical protein
MENGMVMPLGTGCFEAVSAMDAGISLHYSAVDGDESRRLAAGETVRITYNGLIMESYPVQIRADSVTVETDSQTDAETETLNVLDENGERYLVLPVSGDKVRLSNHELAYIDDIDPALLKAAEEKITGLGVAAYALLAAGGDLGASVVPQLLGIVSDNLDMRAGMLSAAIFPLCGIVLILFIKKYFIKKEKSLAKE